MLRVAAGYISPNIFSISASSLNPMQHVSTSKTQYSSTTTGIHNKDQVAQRVISDLSVIRLRRFIPPDVAGSGSS